jgi:hypothetical protein
MTGLVLSFGCQVVAVTSVRRCVYVMYVVCEGGAWEWAVV